MLQSYTWQPLSTIDSLSGCGCATKGTVRSFFQRRQDAYIVSCCDIHIKFCCPLLYSEWIITVGHRSNSESNLPRAEQFDEQADIVAGLPASEMKGAIKRRAWPMCSSA